MLGNAVYIGLLASLLCLSEANQCTSSAKQVDSFCSFFNNRAPKPNPHLKNCTWYADNSCCRQEEIDSIFSKVKPLQGASKHCQRYINYLMCYVCAPTQNKFYKGEKLHVCEDFCNSMYDACKTAILTGSVISDLYGNGRSFCESRSFEVETGSGKESERQCFTKINGGATSKACGLKLHPVLILAIILLSCGIHIGGPNMSSIQAVDNQLKGRRCGNCDKKFRQNVSPPQISPGIVSTVWISILIYLFCLTDVSNALSGSDVSIWARLLSDDLLRLSHDRMRDSSAQELYDSAKYSRQTVDGLKKIGSIKSKLEDFFASKIKLAIKLSEAAKKLHEEHKGNRTWSVSDINLLSTAHFLNAESAWTWSHSYPLTFDRLFNAAVNVNKSVVKLWESASYTDPAVIDTCEWSSQLDHIFKENRARDPAIRWQYFGSSTGLIRSYPARDWPRNHIGFYDDYDPRLRPWYITASSRPKNIVIILDASSSMAKNNRFPLAKKSVEVLLQTLSKRDHVSIIVSQSAYWTTTGTYVNITSTMLSCQTDGLLKVTASNKRLLQASLDDVKPEGATDLKNSMEMAYDILASPDVVGCHNIVFFVGDHDDDDGSYVRCSKGYAKYDANNRRQFSPGKMCKYEWRHLATHIANTRIEKGVMVSVFPLLIKPRGDLSHELLCANHTRVLQIEKESDIYKQLRPYFDYLAQTSGYRHVSVTDPYLDNGGLGLVFTVSVPVYSQVSRILLGVVGIDVSLSSVESILANEVWGSAYAFMIDTQGHTVIHPGIVSSSKLIADPVYVDIGLLEPDSQEFTSVINDMVNQRTGSKRINNTRRAVYTDGAVVWHSVPYTHYVYAGIRNSDYSICMSMADSDEDYRHPVASVRSNGPPSRVMISNDLKAYSAPLWNISSIGLAPRSFCNPEKYINEGLPSVEDMEKYVNSEDFNECPTGLYHRSVRADVKLTSALEQLWVSRPVELQQAIPWTYIGLESGVTRSYPAAPTSVTFDPTTRPWYRHAVVNKGKLAVSSVYRDDGGVGKVVTLSRTIHRGGHPPPVQCNSPSANGCSCQLNSDCESGICLSLKCASRVVSGVLAMDIHYDHWDNMVRRLSDGLGITCGQRCYIVDTSGNFVLNADFLKVSDNHHHLYQEKSLATEHGYIFNDLIQWGVFELRDRIDYQAKCQLDEETCVEAPTSSNQRGPLPSYPSSVACVKTVLYYKGNWTRADQLGVISGSLSGDPCGDGQYYFTAVPDTNLFLLMIDKYKQTDDYLPFNCRIANHVHRPGSFPLLDDPCQASTNTRRYSAAMMTCPILKLNKPEGLCNAALANHMPLKDVLQNCLLSLVWLCVLYSNRNFIINILVTTPDVTALQPLNTAIL